jgi:hypothetical protein
MPAIGLRRHSVIGQVSSGTTAPIGFWSTEQMHEPIVSTDDFARVGELMSGGRNRPATRKPRGTPRTYMLRGLLDCGICGRRMSGQFNNGKPHHRCRYPRVVRVQIPQRRRLEPPRALPRVSPRGYERCARARGR